MCDLENCCFACFSSALDFREKNLLASLVVFTCVSPLKGHFCVKNDSLLYARTHHKIITTQ